MHKKISDFATNISTYWNFCKLSQISMLFSVSSVSQTALNSKFRIFHGENDSRFSVENTGIVLCNIAQALLIRYVFFSTW